MHKLLIKNNNTKIKFIPMGFLGKEAKPVQMHLLSGNSAVSVMGNWIIGSTLKMLAVECRMMENQIQHQAVAKDCMKIF